MLDYANSMGHRWKKEEITNFSTFIFLVAVAVLFFNNLKCRALRRQWHVERKTKDIVHFGEFTPWRGFVRPIRTIFVYLFFSEHA